MKKRISIKVKTTKLSTAGGILPLVAAILFIFSPADVHGWDPFKIGKASKHVHLAISELNATVNKLPDQLKDTIFLFLIGLLLLGLRLFRFLEKRIAFTHLFRHSFILALISFVVIGIFLKTNIPTFHHSIIPFPGKIRKPQKIYIFSVGCRNSETFTYYHSISYHT